ncbi:MAG: GGDEF domain-containing protein [Gammaproteobacteria bacterium]|jgi:diguanylate cyclase (GGDEF)-like protein
MASRPFTGRLLERIAGWQGADADTRARLLQTLCAGVRPQSLISNSLTLVILASPIIAQTRNPVHIVWLAAVILGGLLPRLYAAWLRRSGEFDRATERKAAGFLAVSAVYGLIWGAGPFLLLPEVGGVPMGIFMFIMVFGTIMGPYAAMPGILYLRLATTGIATLTAAALYTTPEITLACLVVTLWLALRTDVWRGYHRTLRRQIELQQVLETQNRNSEALNRQLRRMADTDPLTGAYNRRELMRRIASLRGPAALILIDIDHFKRINDNFGHDVGDHALVDFVALMQGMLRKQDVLARIGGEEFVVLLTDTDRSSAQALAKRLHARIRGHASEIGGHRIRLTISVGIAVVPPGSTVQGTDVLRDADAALYEAKRKGRNRVELADIAAP